MSATRLSFPLPAHLEAAGPPEARGLARDGVRMLVSYRSSGELIHSTFARLPSFLLPGDLVVVNTSGTIGRLRRSGTQCAPDHSRPVVVHFSTWVEGDIWVVELRRPRGASSGAVDGRESAPQAWFSAEGAPALKLLEPYRASTRLWLAHVELPGPVLAQRLAEHGRPIRYGYVDGPWPIDTYQNVYAVEPGSAEIRRGAGRPFHARGHQPVLVANGGGGHAVGAPCCIPASRRLRREASSPIPSGFRFRVGPRTA